jgi:hypothetical protein
MVKARHAHPRKLEEVSIEHIVERYVARFADRKADWNAFEDAKQKASRAASAWRGRTAPYPYVELNRTAIMRFYRECGAP